MGKIQNSGKRRVIISAALALFSVLVTSIATAAWFQLDQTTPTNVVKTADPNLTIKNYVGYKVNTSLNEYGFPSGLAGDAVPLDGDHYEIQTQDQQGEIDTEFDVPNNGVGYYLVKQNNNGTFKFKTGNHTKFTTYSSTNFEKSANSYTSPGTRAYIDTLDISARSVFRIRNYYFNNNETKIEQIQLKASSGSDGVTTSVDATSHDVTVSTPGRYQIWLDYGEESRSNASSDPRPRIYFKKTAELAGKAIPRKNAAGDQTNVYIRGSMSSWNLSDDWRFVESDWSSNVLILANKTISANAEYKISNSDGYWGSNTVMDMASSGITAFGEYNNGTIPKAGTYTFVLVKNAGRLYVTKSSIPVQISGSFNSWALDNTSISTTYDSTNTRYYHNNYEMDKDTTFKVFLYGMAYGYDNLNNTCTAYGDFTRDGEGDANIKCANIASSEYYNFLAVPSVDGSGYLQCAIYVDLAERHTDSSYILRGDHNSWSQTDTTYGLTVKNASTSSEEHYKNKVYLANGAKFIISRKGGNNAHDAGWDQRDTGSMGGSLGTYLSKDGTSNNFIVSNSNGVAFDIFYKPSNNSTPNSIYFNLSTYNISLNLGTAAAAFGKSVTYLNSYTAPTSYTFGTAVTLPVQANMKLGANQYEYKFEGWYTDAACTSSVVTEIPVGQHEDKTFYAKWSQVSGPASPTVEIKLYDPNNYFGNSPKVYAWGATQYATYPLTIFYDMTSDQDSTSKRNYWKVTISTTYTNFKFTSNASFDHESGDYSNFATSPGYFFVGTSIANNKTVTLRKYQALSNQTDTYTFYYFDNRTEKWASPSAYAWNSNALNNGVEQLVPNTADVYQMYEPQNAAWPGVNMTQLTPSEGEAKNVDYNCVWKITVSTSFDTLIFNDGSGSSGDSNQTTNISGISAYDGQFFVIDKTQSAGSRRVGSWHASIYAVEYYASYYYDGVHQSDELIGGVTDYTFGTELFTPNPAGSIPSVINKSNASAGTIHKYEKQGSSFYSSNTCLAGDVADGTGSIDVDGSTHKASLYVKYAASSANHSTIRIDTSYSGNFDNDATQKWANVRISNTDGADFFTMTSSSVIAPDLYEITLPNDFQFRVSNDYADRGIYGAGNNNYSELIDMSLRAGKTYLKINSWTGANCPATWHALDTFGEGSATIHVLYSNGTEVKYLNGVIDDENGTAGIAMEHGNVSVNKFIYEHGLIVPRACKIYIEWNGVTYDYDDYLTTPTPPAYVGHSGTAQDAFNYITPSFTDDHMRFNFYITSNNKLTIAMVPERGNGYYLVPYLSAYGTDSYIGAKQMASGGPLYASYSGLHIQGATALEPVKYCIRSYLEGKDTLYTSLPTKPDSVSIDGGVISFTADGYYDIVVQNGAITITTYVQDTSFTLNPIDLSANGSATAVFNQRTSLVIEVSFTCNNPYSSTISLDLNAPAFVGASLYVTDSQLANPYSYMRANCYYDGVTTNTGLNNSGASDRNSFSIPANSGETYYAYILIDYLPASGTMYDNFLSTYTSTISCYLRSSQA